MALSDHDQSRIRQYLLGHLTEEEEQALEERLIVDDDLFEELEISKGELIEEYRAGGLNPKENSALEQGYLASPEGRQRYSFTAALDCLPVSVAATPPHATLLDRLRSFLTMQRWKLATVAGVVLIAIVAVQVSRLSHPRTSIA